MAIRQQQTRSWVISTYSTGKAIFEGAQGLLLDQSHAYFPHVTRSYLTRHGAGTFPSELPNKPYRKIEDRTNVYNPYQGQLRFGLLDLDSLAVTIQSDMQYARGMNTELKLAVTCVDQIDDQAIFISGSNQQALPVNDFLHQIFATVGAKQGYVSSGPSRDSIVPF